MFFSPGFTGVFIAAFNSRNYTVIFSIQFKVEYLRDEILCITLLPSKIITIISINS